MRASLFVFSFFLLSLGVAAQSSYTDSLTQAYHQADNDSARLRLLLELCRQNDLSDDSFARYVRIASQLADKVGNNDDKANAAYYLAWYYNTLSENDSTRYVVDQVLPLIDRGNDTSRAIFYKLNVLKAYSYRAARNNAQALEMLYPLLTEAEEYRDSVHVANILHMIALCEEKQGNVEKALSTENKALAWLPQKGNNAERIRPTILATMGKIYLEKGEYQTAHHYNEQALHYFRENNDPFNEAIVIQRQVIAELRNGRIDSAGQLIGKLTGIHQQYKSIGNDINFHLAFANYYLYTRQYPQLIALCRERLANDNLSEAMRTSYLELLAKAYKDMGDTGLHAATLERLIEAQDAANRVNTADAIATAEARHNLQVKEKTILQQELALTQKNTLYYSTIGIVVASGIILWLLFRNYNRKKKMQLEIVQQQEAIRTRFAIKEAEENERKRIAADLHDNLGSYAASIKANVDEMQHPPTVHSSALELLQANSQQMVALLGDTIWALRKEKMKLSDISDRTKVFLQRLRPSYPTVSMLVEEHIDEDIELLPNQAYNLIMIIQEAVNNALRHSGAGDITVAITSRSRWQITIRDNGRGMMEDEFPAGGGNGLYNMQMRASGINCDIVWGPVQPSGTAVVLQANTI